MKERRAELGLALRIDTAAGHRSVLARRRPTTAPLALFIHGGYWRSLEPAMFSQVARGLNAHGVAVAVAGYDLCPQVTIAEIIDQIRHACLFLWLRIGQRMMVFGHSAGGHLAAAMLATDWQALYPKAPADLVPAAYSISGLFDLTPLLHDRHGARSAADEADDARRSRRCSGRRRAGACSMPWSAAGIQPSSCARAGSSRRPGRRPASQTRYEEIAGTNHFTVLDPLRDPQSAMVGGWPSSRELKCRLQATRHGDFARANGCQQAAPLPTPAPSGWDCL